MAEQQDLFGDDLGYAPKRMPELNGQRYYKDFSRYFDGKRAIVKTNYKLLQRVEIHFHIEQLVHLLGLQKVLNQSVPKILQAMAADEIDFRRVRRAERFPQILPRLYNYDFLHEIFYDTLYKTLISTHMLVPNTQNLDAIFFKPTNLANNRHVVLGLRRIGEIYVPVTLHEIHNLKRLRVQYATVNQITLV